MTTLALNLGMLPVAIGLGTGSSFRQPMALAVIGALIASTILTCCWCPQQPTAWWKAAWPASSAPTRRASPRGGQGSAEAG